MASGAGYRIRKLRYEIVPGFQSTAVLYEPAEVRGKVPAILNVHGHVGPISNAGATDVTVPKRRSVNARPVTVLILGLAAGACLGVIARTRNWLGNSVDSDVKMWFKTGLPEQELYRRLLITITHQVHQAHEMPSLAKNSLRNRSMSTRPSASFSPKKAERSHSAPRSSTLNLKIFSGYCCSRMIDVYPISPQAFPSKRSAGVCYGVFYVTTPHYSHTSWISLGWFDLWSKWREYYLSRPSR